MSAPTQIAHYRITGKLGEGGMGAVYRATDMKLNREVAVKVLPDNLGFDPDRYARFAREAQLLASLNHPNIATIYGVEDRAIIMELVEGAPIKGPLTDDQALPLIGQLIDALEYAHDKTVIHRDLKPANILLTADGRIKVLDFGLAKALSPEQAPVANPSLSPTLTMGGTVAGVIMGTASYMSPEQARGSNVDRRADIWSFGVVLYELLTGKQLFEGENISDVLAAVLRQEIDFALVPARFQRLLRMCLTRDPKLRLRDISGARLLLEDAPQVTATTRRPWLPWAVAGVACVATAAAWLWPKPQVLTPGVARFDIPHPEGTGRPTASGAPQAVPSPDGKNIVFVVVETASGKNSLWIRPLGAPTPHRLDQTEDANFPFWSPDSQFIAYFASEKLKRIAVSGGSIQTICDLEAATPNGRLSLLGGGGAWSPEGVIVYSSGSGPLQRVPAVGGVPTPATTLAPDEIRHSWPQFLPDGRLLYFAANKTSSKNGVYVQDVGATARTLVTESASLAAWAQPGYLLFVREGTLLARRMDPKSLQLQGEPFTVAENVTFNATIGRAAFSVSPRGVLAYRSGAASASVRQLAWYDRSGRRIAPLGKPGAWFYPVISPDGKRLALYMDGLSGSGSKPDAWVMDLSTEVVTRLTRGGTLSGLYPPVWSPDSQRLAVTESNGGIVEVVADSGKSAPLAPQPLAARGWMPDGATLLVSDLSTSRYSFFKPGPNAKPSLLLETPYFMRQLRLSSDGRHLAYASNEAEGSDIYVASFPSFAEKRKVSSGGGISPLWSRNGKELYFANNAGSIFSAEIRTSPNLAASVPKLLFPAQAHWSLDGFNIFAASADGQRFLIAEELASRGDQNGYRVVVNWAADLK